MVTILSVAEAHFRCICHGIHIIKQRQKSFGFWTEHVAELMKHDEKFNNFLKNYISTLFSLMAPYLRYFDRKPSDEEILKAIARKIDNHGFGQVFLNPSLQQ
eukprot:c13509_g1_i1.p2 GENE.c13509_g1_i1~~c13509_g1_i1.p2  ORF type:complete len:102 (+),score=1.99 c13509_g1_i1:67-372(+)